MLRLALERARVFVCSCRYALLEKVLMAQENSMTYRLIGYQRLLVQNMTYFVAL